MIKISFIAIFIFGACFINVAWSNSEFLGKEGAFEYLGFDSELSQSSDDVEKRSMARTGREQRREVCKICS